ncbi:MAG: acetate/propionate family kinase [bacterium]|jgi:acetate kinase|nr:acetate kinase [bacterium]
MKVLVINCGSSSLKFQLIDMQNKSVLARGLVDRIGVQGSSLFKFAFNGGKEEREVRAGNHQKALETVIQCLTAPGKGPLASLNEIDAVGHRVLHGGKVYQSALIDENIKTIINDCSIMGPLHNPPALMGINAAEKLLPGVPQVAVFDTAFFHTMPEKAYTYALPYEICNTYGIRRYGFHGTSHRYVVRHALQLPELADKEKKDLSLITCHLGNGCSITASVGGQAIDTSMGFTPLEGLVMGTRCGDIDPAIVPFLQKNAGMAPEEIDTLMNKKSGLLGLTGISSDMRDIEEAAERGEERAVLALDIFCYRIIKYIGAYTFAMGRVDAICFTAGIGENSPTVRKRICNGLNGLGVELDEQANVAAFGSEAVISSPASKVLVAVVPTDEELMIAMETREVIA